MCVKAKKRGLSSSGVCVCWRMWEGSTSVFGAAGVPAPTPWCHTPSSDLASSGQCLRLCKVTHSRCSGPGTREPLMALGGQGRAAGGPPFEGEAFIKAPLSASNPPGAAFYSRARAPLLFLVAGWQMVFLPLYDYKWFFEKLF